MSPESCIRAWMVQLKEGKRNCINQKQLLVSAHLHLWFLFLQAEAGLAPATFFLKELKVNLFLICFSLFGTGKLRRNCKMLSGMCLIVLGDPSFDNWSMTGHRGDEESPVMMPGLLEG